MFDKLFHLKENKTTPRIEMLAGLTTFMTMAYILAVNPDILSASGMPKGGIFIATALAAALGSILMALLANYPIALAPGLGLNAFFSYTVVLSMGYSWQFALLAVFVEGLIFLVLSLTSVREQIFNSIPQTLKIAVAVGIGLFVAFIALRGGKIVVDDGATLVNMVNFSKTNFHTEGVWALLSCIGIVLTAILETKKLRPAILIGIFSTWILGIIAELVGLYVPDPATGFYTIIPHFENYFSSLGNSFSEFGSTCGALFNPDSWTHTENGTIVSQGFKLVTSLDFFVVMFAFFFVDLFDTLGTLIGVSLKGGFLTPEGKLPRISGALYADSVATAAGAVLGTSTTTSYIESTSGVTMGGRTGLTAATTGALFLSAILFAPVFTAIPSFATAPALMIVAFAMMTSIVKIDFSNKGEAIPAFICMITMPLTYSISNGIMFGVISYTLMNALLGKAKDIHPIMWILTVVFIAKFALM